MKLRRKTYYEKHNMWLITKTFQIKKTKTKTKKQDGHSVQNGYCGRSSVSGFYCRTRVRWSRFSSPGDNIWKLIRIGFTTSRKICGTDSVFVCRRKILGRNKVYPPFAKFSWLHAFSIWKAVKGKVWIPFIIVKAFRNTAREATSTSISFRHTQQQRYRGQGRLEPPPLSKLGGGVELPSFLSKNATFVL